MSAFGNIIERINKRLDVIENQLAITRAKQVMFEDMMPVEEIGPSRTDKLHPRFTTWDDLWALQDQKGDK